MQTVTISRKKVFRAVLLLVAIAGLIGGGTAVVGGLRDTASAAQEVEAAAAHGIGEALRFDHEEGRDAWAERVEPLCTETGWSFWNLVGAQTWPRVMAQEYAVRSIEVLGTEVMDEADDSGQVTVLVRLRIEYVQEGETESEEKSYPVVMVERDGEWLMDVGDMGNDDCPDC